MNIKELFEDIEFREKIYWHPRRTVRKITSDSRAVEPGDVFVACAGSRMDGHDFLIQAIQAKPAAVVFEHSPEVAIPPSMTAIRVSHTHVCLAELLNRFYGNPGAGIKLIGVTGTNGKTTIAYLLHRLLSQKTSAAYLGTLWYELPSGKIPAVNTTPGPEVLIPLLAELRDAGVRYCVMEVSSHALDQFRVHGLPFELAIFTQLTQDHLDYHHNLENYFQAKRKLFSEWPRPKHCLINADCPYGERLLNEIEGAKSFSAEKPSNYRASEIQISLQGSVFDFCCGSRKIPTQIRLPMRHNVSNVTAVLSALHLLGFDPEDFGGSLREISGIPGRMERISGSRGIEVFVDYAHTPDAFEHVLGESRKLVRRRLLCVFGCGGDRDKGKRPMMTAIACRYSDVVALTLDNPRSEDPESIMADMKQGISDEAKTKCAILEIQDRRKAIEHILSLAESGDAVLILGKGHEDYQILGDRKIPFDDRVIAKEYFARESRVLLS